MNDMMITRNMLQPYFFDDMTQAMDDFALFVGRDNEDCKNYAYHMRGKLDIYMSMLEKIYGIQFSYIVMADYYGVEAAEQDFWLYKVEGRWEYEETKKIYD